MQTNLLLNRKYIVNGDTSGASVVGPWLLIADLNSIAFLVECTGTPTGTFSGELTNVDNNVDPNVTPPAAALIVPADSPASFASKQPAGAAVNTIFEWNPAPTAMWLRFKYARSAGGAANALQVQAMGKGI